MIAGQAVMVLCCILYIIWWYRCYRPGTLVDRTHGFNGILLFLIIVTGFSGIALSFQNLPFNGKLLIADDLHLSATAAVFIFMLVVTLFIFRRSVTSELFIITIWTAVETAVCNRMYAGSLIGKGSYITGLIIIALAFCVSMIMYVLYYRMEENRAFYAAMVPLVAAAFTAAALLLMIVF